MHLDRLNIRQFRNITAAEVEFSPGFNVFYGANAQGKSNVLEAIYTLSFLKGFRAERLRDLIEFDAERSFLSGDVVSEVSRTRLSLEIDGHCRRAFVDGESCRRAGEYLGILRAILFVPADVSFLQESPALRRVSLDRMVFNLRPAYLLDLEQYQKIAKQVSAVLRSDIPDESLLRVYDEQLERVAVRLIEARYDYLSLLSSHVQHVFSQIFDEGFDCGVVYKSATTRGEIAFGVGEVMSRDEVVSSYLESRRHGCAQEVARRQMMPGPHRDDWTIQLNGRPARYFASQGQQRSMCLAVKMAEIECLNQEAGMEPVFLLDDVSSELDPVRHKRLFEHLNAITAQTFLTTTAREHVHLESIGRMFHVENGRIEYEC